jgi:sialate O-acetylesterase
VGLINSSVGGTPIDSWIDASVQRSCKDLAPLLSKQPTVDLVAAKASYEKQKVAWQAAAKEARAKKQPVPKAPRDPVATLKRKADIGGLFNGKIAPLIPYSVRGFLWYQGEANSVPEKAPFYQHHLPLLVQDWRTRWGDPQAPFAWVQLPNFIGRGEGWCLVREAMSKTLRLPNTGMAVTIDVGDPKDIHPKNKQEVGRRLSLWALGSVYGKAGATSGPRYGSHEILGPHVVIKMSHADGGLVTKGDKGFVICGEDRQWKPASVKLDGPKLFVSSTDVPKPVAVRYAWAEVPEVTLWNAAGLPASPFRTDDFPVEFADQVVGRKTPIPENQ